MRKEAEDAYEYAGFKYIPVHKGNGIVMEPVPGQHKAAYKEKHRQAALQQYLEDKRRKETR